MQQACPSGRRLHGGKILGTAPGIRAHIDMVGSTCFAGVAMLTLIAPFEVTAPLLPLPQQSVSNLELAVVVAFVCAAAALVATRRVPEWRTPLTPPWLLLFSGSALTLPVSA